MLVIDSKNVYGASTMGYIQYLGLGYISKLRSLTLWSLHSSGRKKEKINIVRHASMLDDKCHRKEKK